MFCLSVLFNFENLSQYRSYFDNPLPSLWNIGGWDYLLPSGPILSSLLCLPPPQFRLAVISSKVTVLCQVVLGLPRFLFPGGAYLKATLGMWSPSFLRTWLKHCSRRCLISSAPLTVCFCTSPHWRSFLSKRCNISSEGALIFLHVTLNHSPAFWAVQQKWFTVRSWLFGAVLLWTPHGLKACHWYTSWNAALFRL